MNDREFGVYMSRLLTPNEADAQAALRQPLGQALRTAVGNLAMKRDGIPIYPFLTHKNRSISVT